MSDEAGSCVIPAGGSWRCTASCSVAEDAGFRVLQTVEAPRSHPHGNREVFIDLGRATEQAAVATGR